jgi:hypothetical protein
MKTSQHSDTTGTLHVKDFGQIAAGSDEENQVQSSRGYDSNDEDEDGNQDDALSTSTSEGQEYQINPRISLMFRDVWVSDRSMDPSLPRRVFNGLQDCCKLRWKQCEASKGKRGSSWSVAEARLEAAAADGAKFIVPGVSGWFAHSQLHAIMGPSGCGKSTLCKALAGRLPMSRVAGDIRVVCSAAADGFQSKSELAMAGCQTSCSLRLDVANMTGFVPQFDLLHETLTVRWIDQMAPCWCVSVSLLDSAAQHVAVLLGCFMYATHHPVAASFCMGCSMSSVSHLGETNSFMPPLAGRQDKRA